jgi:hypothetical protein
MALLFIGSTTCALCGQLLLDKDDVAGLPPLADKQHPLYKYFDAGFHASCFNNWDEKEAALRILEEERQKYIKSDYFKEMALKHGKPKGLAG